MLAQNGEEINDVDFIVNKNYYEQFYSLIHCTICDGFVIDPMSCSMCESNYCKECIHSWIRKNKSCPLRCVNAEFRNPPRATKLILEKILIKCFKCSQEISYFKYKDHLEVACIKLKVKCPNEDCNELIGKGEMDMHLKECVCSKVSCEECGSMVKKKNLKNLTTSLKEEKINLLIKIADIKSEISSFSKISGDLTIANNKYKEENCKHVKEIGDLKIENQKLKNDYSVLYTDAYALKDAYLTILKENQQCKTETESLNKKIIDLTTQYDDLNKKVRNLINPISPAEIKNISSTKSTIQNTNNSDFVFLTKPLVKQCSICNSKEINSRFTKEGMNYCLKCKPVKISNKLCPIGHAFIKKALAYFSVVCESCLTNISTDLYQDLKCGLILCEICYNRSIL